MCASAQHAGEAMATFSTTMAGQVDENGILWKATAKAGVFNDTISGMDNLFDTIVASAAKNADKDAAGERSIVEQTFEGKFEKLSTKLGSFE